jgi:hypothetical protein
MKRLSLKHSGSETKILALDDIRVRIGSMMRSPHCCSRGGLPSLFSVLGLATDPYPFATTVAILRHVYTQLNPQAKLEQLKLSKTDPST